VGGDVGLRAWLIGVWLTCSAVGCVPGLPKPKVLDETRLERLLDDSIWRESPQGVDGDKTSLRCLNGSESHENSALLTRGLLFEESASSQMSNVRQIDEWIRSKNWKTEEEFGQNRGVYRKGVNLLYALLNDDSQGLTLTLYLPDTIARCPV
jgi:hypothetical protein